MPAPRRVLTRRALTFTSAFLLSIAIAAPAMAQIEEVVVTAQKKSEDVMSVPIAISAFNERELKARQIVQFKDLQFSTPNVSYSKGNFSGANFQIRGIGTQVVSGGAEGGVAINMNGVYLVDPPLAESTFYDLNRIEVLRGPQSTLYGRGATGGSVNVITAKPDLEEFHASGEFSYGNYNAKEVKGWVNIPIITDQLGVRVAADWVKRDGYVTNIANNSKIDGRDQYSVRGSVRWQPTNKTTVDLMLAYSHESDSHMRSQKQLCSYDPTGTLGCLPDSLGTGVININSTLSTIASSRQALGGFGTLFGEGTGVVVAQGAPYSCPPPDLAIFPYYSNAGCAAVVSGVTASYTNAFTNMGLYDLSTQPVPPAPANILNPPDLRKVNTDFTPKYAAQDQLLTAHIRQQVTHWLDATLVLGHDHSSTWSQESYNNVQGLPFDPTTLGTAEAYFFGTLGATFGTAYANNYLPYFSVPGQLPVSGIGNLGITGGNTYGYFNHVTAFDQSDISQTQDSAELRFQSKLDGPLNFLLAGYYLKQTLNTDYYVNANTFDYPFIILGAFLGGTDPGCYPQGCLDPGYYHNDTRRGSLESRAMFGELYYTAIPDTLKFTVGARWTVDTKTQSNRIFIFPGPVPIGTNTENAANAYLGNSDPYINLSQTYKKLTGRFVADWTPKVDFTNKTLVYASYAHGYKAGGFNPGIQPGLTVPATYKPEAIDAFEVGTKNILIDGMLQANGDVYYYDYKDMQVSTIFNNTSVNQNIDATIWGVEGQFVWQATNRLQFNLNFGNTNTSIGNTLQVDPRNPTGGRSDVVLVKGATLGASVGQNCILYMINGQTVTPANNAAFQAAIPGLYFDPPGGASALAAHGVAHANYGDCGQNVPESVMNAFGYSYSDPTGAGGPDGVPVNLKGKELAQTPKFTLSVGAQYTQPLGDDYSLVGRVDYYWQSNMFGRIFNGPADKIPSWDVMNAKVTLNSGDGLWYITGYIKNVMDKTNVTGEYLTSSTSGLYTNVFLGDPRTYGVTLGVHL